MMEKRFWSGAIAVVTLIVAGAGALPELLLRPASAPSVALPRNAPKAEPVAPPEEIAVVTRGASVPDVNRADTMAPPEPSTTEPAPQVAAAVPEPPKPQSVVLATPAPAPPVAFPPVQPVGVGATSAPGVIPPAAPQPISANAAHPMTTRPVERAVQRPAKPKQNMRPAAYPIGEFLVSRR